MGLKRERINEFWICDNCHNFFENNEWGYKKYGYNLCPKCKHLRKEVIERNKY